MKKVYILLTFIFLVFNCSNELPKDTGNIIKKFLTLRNQENYAEMYNLFYKKSKFETFHFKEVIYKKRFGKIQEYNISKWAKRKNFSCGPGSGKMLSVTVSVQYQYGNSIETFTLINTRNSDWKIFDYYFKPVI